LDPTIERQVELPDPQRSGGSVLWKLSERGLEWDGGQSRAAWMPFACMRRVTLGHVSALGGWRLNISGPPGSVLIGSSHFKATETPKAAARFIALARDIIRGAGERGCPAKFRVNNGFLGPAIIWSRLGTPMPNYEAVLQKLDVSPK